MEQDQTAITMTSFRAKRHALSSWLPLAAGVLWGTAFPAVGLALAGFSPLSVAFWRAIIACLSLGLWLAWRRAFTGRPTPVQWARLAALSLAGAGFFWPAMAFSIELSNPVNSAFLVGIYPAITAAVAPMVLGERIRPRNFVSLGAAVVGAYLVISKGRPLDLFASSTLAGDTLALLAATSFGTYIILGQKWRHKVGVTSGELTFYTFALSLPVLGILAVSSGPLVADLDLQVLGAILWLGLMASTGAFLALNRGMRQGAVARGSVHLMVIPLVAALATWIIFGTTMESAQWLGGALVVLAVGISR